MTNPAPPSLRVAIACGGSGGHLFPGLAVAQQLRRCNAAVTLLISPKEVDQQALRSAWGLEIATLPAVGLRRGGEMAFVGGFARSYRAAKAVFKSCPPQAALAMGGFTSAPPLLAARRLGARVFLHESNSVPGRANRWLSWLVHRAFVGFPAAGPRLHTSKVTVSGTPVRSEFQPREAAGCRAALGLDPGRPVLLVMGGSQGASAINSLVSNMLPLLARGYPHWQWFHLAGPAEVQAVKRAYATAGLSPQVHPFFSSMELALGAATAAISRAGASSLAELAAMRLPSVLIPYPAATDDHQLHNARALQETGAARLLEQKAATPESLAALLADLVENSAVRAAMQEALARWHCPRAASEIAQTILETIAAGSLAPHSQPNRRVSGVPVAAASTIFSLLLS
jgi:UDP-N-acetylglucosamine--N-acetylmuramyl-(pentapeptide) pyrophosphoryl-undecaprenol N-acetylglucosamine transferase